MKFMNSLAITLEEDKRFLCVWLFYYVSNFADSRMEVPWHQSSPSSWDHFFLSQCIQYAASRVSFDLPRKSKETVLVGYVFGSCEVLGKISSIRSKLPTAACWERKLWSQPALACFMSTLVPQTDHSQYSSPIEALNLIGDSKSQPVELYR